MTITSRVTLRCSGKRNTDLLRTLVRRSARTPRHVIAHSRQSRPRGYRAIPSAFASLDQKINDDWTALYLAAYNGPLPVVQALLEAGANPNVKADYGSAALIAAVQSEQTAIVDLLLIPNSVLLFGALGKQKLR